MEAFPLPPQPTIALESEAVAPVGRGTDAPELKDRVEFGGSLVTSIDKRYRADGAGLYAFIRGHADRIRFLIPHVSVNFPVSYPPPLLIPRRSASRLGRGSGCGSTKLLRAGPACPPGLAQHP